MDRINLPHLEIKEHHIVIKECTIKDQLQYFKQRDIKLHTTIKDMEAKHNNVCQSRMLSFHLKEHNFLFRCLC
jgi:hypothetical protein